VSFSCFSLLQADSAPTEAQNGETKKSIIFPLGGEVFVAFDGFRSLPDGSWGGNLGAYFGMNLSAAIPKTSESVGIQGGWSYGVYDWDGRGSTDSKAVQQQGFVTTGFFYRTPHLSGVNGGVVYDWSFNRKAGVFGLSPTMQQVRAQLGYIYKKKNEFGLWGSYGTTTARNSFYGMGVEFRAISQVNAFWRHIFNNNGEIMLWGGTPYRKGLMFESGRPGAYILGAAFQAPLTRSLSLQGDGMYMGSRSGSAFSESKNYAANVCIALTYSFGSKSPGCRPYLPLANNGNFIADTNLSY